MKTINSRVRTWFCVPEHEKVSEQAFLRIMLSSVLGILLCGTCLTNLTWALFTSSVTSNANHITAAHFSAGVEFTQNGSLFPPAFENGSYELESGNYTVTLTAAGSASTGYCTVVLKASDEHIDTYHTVPLYPAGGEGQPKCVTFTVAVSDTAYLTITPQWGTYAAPENEALIGNGEEGNLSELSIFSLSLLGAEPEETCQLTETEQLYTVQPGDTLPIIAAKYGTTAEVLAAYNGVETDTELQEGQTLKIPPVSYTIVSDPEGPAADPGTSGPEPTDPDTPASSESSEPETPVSSESSEPEPSGPADPDTPASDPAVSEPGISAPETAEPETPGSAASADPPEPTPAETIQQASGTPQEQGEPETGTAVAAAEEP